MNPLTCETMAVSSLEFVLSTECFPPFFLANTCNVIHTKRVKSIRKDFDNHSALSFSLIQSIHTLFYRKIIPAADMKLRADMNLD